MKFAAQILGFVLGVSGAFSQFSPDPPTECGLKVSLKAIGEVPPGNLNAGVPIGTDLYLIDQGLGKIYLDADAKGNPVKIFDIATQAPAGLTFGFADTLTEYVSNVSPGPSDDEIYVGFQSTTLPAGLVAYGTGDLPAAIREKHSAGQRTPASKPVDLYRLGDLESCAAYCCLCSNIFPGTFATIFHVIYKYSVEDGSLTDPVPLAAFATQSGPTHKGGGMATLPNGRLLFATGDGLPFGTNGREGAQDDATSVSKLFAISPTGEVELLAKGLRQPQRLEIVAGSGNQPDLLAIGEIGGVTAEEINVASLEDLLDTSEVENFGWGIAAGEDFGREGTFKVGPGIAGIFGTQPPAIGVAPVDEPGYIQPHAQYGRFDPSAFIAVAGPVTSLQSFDTIKTLFVDLPSGQFLATVTSGPGAATFGTNEQVCEVSIVDVDSQVLSGTVNEFFSSGTRLDPRLFRFPNGKAGVILERTGKYYEIKEE